MKSALGSNKDGLDLVVNVTTIMDIAKKEPVREPLSGGKKRCTGVTLKGSGTTYLNTVMTSVPTIMDVDTLVETSKKLSSEAAKDSPNTSLADGDILINDIAVAPVLGSRGNEKTILENVDHKVPIRVSVVTREKSAKSTVKDGEGVIKSAERTALGVVD